MGQLVRRAVSFFRHSGLCADFTLEPVCALRYSCRVSTDGQCPFCHLSESRVWLTTTHSVAFFDGYPVAQGHALVIPRRHVASLFDLSAAEFADAWALVTRVRQELVERFHPDSFNVGVNDGPAAGQTVPHAHIHIIPRRAGDVPDARGGVRWVIPGKADYWTKR